MAVKLGNPLLDQDLIELNDIIDEENDDDH